MYRQFTFEDSLSKAGGLVGLLAGASILSLIEFLYFFSFRMGPLIINVFKKMIFQKKHKILIVKPAQEHQKFQYID